MLGRPVEKRIDEELLREVYPLLRETAQRMLRGERQGHTRQPTALVHEFFIRMFGKVPEGAQSAQGFLRLAAHQMRQVLIDYGRRRSSVKRGGEFSRVPLFDSHECPEVDWDSSVDLNQALDRLGEFDSRA